MGNTPKSQEGFALGSKYLRFASLRHYKQFCFRVLGRFVKLGRKQAFCPADLSKTLPYNGA